MQDVVRVPRVAHQFVSRPGAESAEIHGCVWVRCGDMDDFARLHAGQHHFGAQYRQRALLAAHVHGNGWIQLSRCLVHAAQCSPYIPRAGIIVKHPVAREWFAVVRGFRENASSQGFR